jgi:hypothetical protein
MVSAATDASTPTHSNALTPIAVSVGTLTSALILVIARLYTRICIVKQVGADDWTILVAWVCLCVLSLLFYTSSLR